MRILYLHQYYRTPEEGGALRSYFLSTAMAAAGHEVTLITAHDQTTETVRQINGVKVHYLPVPYANHFTFWQRSWAFVQFLFRSSVLAMRLPAPDLVYASSTPLTVGIPALLLKFLKRVPYVFEVRDLWPEAPIQLGAIRNKVLIWLLRKLERTLYKESRLVVALSPGMEAGVKEAAPEKDVLMIPNMADCAFYQPVPKPDKYHNWEIKNKFVLVYTGALGLANRVDFLLDLAAAANQLYKDRFLFLIAGSGALSTSLKQRISQEELHNVGMLGKLDRNQIKELLQAADATYTSFDQQPVLETNSPNKFFDSLAAGRISFVNTEGWLKELVTRHECGFYLAPNHPEKAAHLLADIAKNEGLRKQLQMNARKLAEENFSKEKLSYTILNKLEDLIISSK